MSIISRTLVPNISIIDPKLLTTKPPELIIASAIDAMSHAIEAYVSRIAFAFTDIQSLKATALRDIVKDAGVLPPICQMAAQDACLITNPREATWEAMLQICEASW